MTFGTPTDLPELLAAVRTRLVSVSGVAPHLVFPTVWPEEDLLDKPPGNQFLTVRPLTFPGVASLAAGAGTAARAYDGRVRVSVFYRLDLDQFLRSADWLTKDPGPLATWLKVLGGLEQYAPPRAADPTKCLLIEPMRNDPGFEVPQRKLPPGWSQIDSTWQLKFVHRLS